MQVLNQHPDQSSRDRESRRYCEEAERGNVECLVGDGVDVTPTDFCSAASIPESGTSCLLPGSGAPPRETDSGCALRKPSNGAAERASTRTPLRGWRSPVERRPKSDPPGTNRQDQHCGQDRHPDDAASIAVRGPR